MTRAATNSHNNTAHKTFRDIREQMWFKDIYIYKPKAYFVLEIWRKNS